MGKLTEKGRKPPLREAERRAKNYGGGHTKLESTVRYLGIEVDDALELAEQTAA